MHPSPVRAKFRCRAIAHTVCTLQKPLRLWRAIKNNVCVCVCVCVSVCFAHTLAC